jgi:hypothetical protein
MFVEYFLSSVAECKIRFAECLRYLTENASPVAYDYLTLLIVYSAKQMISLCVLVNLPKSNISNDKSHVVCFHFLNLNVYTVQYSKHLFNDTSAARRPPPTRGPRLPARIMHAPRRLLARSGRPPTRSPRTVRDERSIASSRRTTGRHRTTAPANCAVCAAGYS